MTSKIPSKNVIPADISDLANLPSQWVCRIPEQYAGCRLDQTLAELQPAYSRSRWQAWIKAGAVQVNGQPCRPKDTVRGGEWVQGQRILPTPLEILPEAIPLTICYEDDQLIVVDKEAGLVVHPAAGHYQGTLVNALLYHAPELAYLPRAGLIHRLDKDTSGLLVVARTLAAHTDLVAQLQARQIEREYEAIVTGVLASGGTVNAPIGRHPVDRQRMVVISSGKPAITHYRVIRRFTLHTHLRVQLETGRTHQIRVHMAHIRYPLLGDPLYGGRLRLPPDASPTCRAVITQFKRQALHAVRLALRHPQTGERMAWHSSLPADFSSVLSVLRS